MALRCSKLFSRTIKNHLMIANRYASSSSELELPDPLELATGKEKFQLMQMKAGNDDPFNMKAVKRHPSSRTNPNIVHSYYDCRIVGCVCEEDSNSIVWMWLFKGEPRRCHCGHWFQLAEYKPL